MNDQILSHLQQQVDQIITPLRATRRRKSLMREELLAHLLDIYETETTHSDPPAALTQTLRRFGDSTSLSKDLQSSVPIFERILQSLYNKEPTMNRLWLTLLLTGIAGLAFGLSLILPALAKLKLEGRLPGGHIIPIVIGAIIMYTGFQICCWGLARKIKKAT